MTDQKTQPNLSGQPEQAKPEQATPPEQMGQQGQRRPAGGLAQPIPRTAAGRRPLFRSN
jgi:hypothetical protein